MEKQEHTMVNVLIDYHHTDLFYSLQTLFRDRLGMNVYRPKGMEWYHEDWWAVNNQADTAKQYLVDNKIGQGVTVEQFKDMQFDILVASIPVHLHRYEKIRQLYKPNCKVIMQAGNNWGAIPANNLLNSARKNFSSVGGNTVFYHQEFDLERFKPGPCQKIRSIINLEHYGNVAALHRIAEYLPGWEIKIYGVGGKDGPVPAADIPQTIRDAGFVWHSKRNEGYGYNIYNTFACGRPMIVDVPGNKGCTCEELFASNTVIDMYKRDARDVARDLMRVESMHSEATENVYKQFTDCVDFDTEEQEIRKFIERLR